MYFITSKYILWIECYLNSGPPKIGKIFQIYDIM